MRGVGIAQIEADAARRGKREDVREEMIDAAGLRVTPALMLHRTLG